MRWGRMVLLGLFARQMSRNRQRRVGQIKRLFRRGGSDVHSDVGSRGDRF